MGDKLIEGPIRMKNG